MRNLSELQSLFIETSVTLCKKVREQLRAVKVDVDEDKKNVYFWYYYDGEISNDDYQQLESVTNMTVSDVQFSFSPPYTVLNSIQRLDYPQPLPVAEGYFVYIRDETIFKDKPCHKIEINSDLYLNEESSAFKNLCLLSIYALLGRVRPNLRIFSIDINEKKGVVFLSFYFDGEISQDDRNIAKRVINDVSTSFYGRYSFESSVERIDFPGRVPLMGFQIYARDESIYLDEELFYQQYAPKEWHDLITGHSVIYKQQSDTKDFLYRRISKALLGKIRANWSAVQISINELKRVVTVWIHTHSEVTEDVIEMSDTIKMIAFDTSYTAKIHTLSLNESAVVPALGRFLFLREEIIQEEHIKASYETLRALLADEIKALWSMSDSTVSKLRAVKLDILDQEQNFFIVFIFSSDYTREDKEKAIDLTKKITSRLFHGYTYQSYIARYDNKEILPTFGHTVYVANQETIEGEDIRTLFYESVVDALAGKVNPDLRVVKADVDEFKKKAFFWFYYDREVTEQDKLSAEVVADLSCPMGYVKVLEVEHVACSDRIPTIGSYIYRRFEW